MRKIFILNIVLGLFLASPAMAFDFGQGAKKENIQLKELNSDLNNQLSSAVDEIEGLQSENYKLKSQLAKEKQSAQSKIAAIQQKLNASNAKLAAANSSKTQVAQNTVPHVQQPTYQNSKQNYSNQSYYNNYQRQTPKKKKSFFRKLFH